MKNSTAFLRIAKSVINSSKGSTSLDKAFAIDKVLSLYDVTYCLHEVLIDLNDELLIEDISEARTKLLLLLVQTYKGNSRAVDAFIKNFNRDVDTIDGKLQDRLSNK